MIDAGTTTMDWAPLATREMAKYAAALSPDRLAQLYAAAEHVARSSAENAQGAPIVRAYHVHTAWRIALEQPGEPSPARPLMFTLPQLLHACDLVWAYSVVNGGEAQEWMRSEFRSYDHVCTHPMAPIGSEIVPPATDTQVLLPDALRRVLLAWAKTVDES